METFKKMIILFLMLGVFLAIGCTDVAADTPVEESAESATLTDPTETEKKIDEITIQSLPDQLNTLK